MKVLFTNDSPIIKYGIAQGVADLGHEVQILPLWKYPRDKQQTLMIEKADEFKPDFVFCEGHSGLNQKALFAAKKTAGFVLAYWAIEDPPHFDWISLPYARNSDLVFTTADNCLAKYTAHGIDAQLLLFGCHPQYLYHDPQYYPEYDYDIAVVASNYDIRYAAARQMVLPLVEKGYNIHIWGTWWDDETRPVHLPARYTGGILPYERLPQVYSNAKVVLGLHCDATSLTQTSMRTYEVLGCKGFYLTQYTPAHEHLFENGKHLVWSKSAEETVQLVDYYLAHPEERLRIAQNGQREVYEKHNYQIRAQQLVEAVGKLL